jgi:hypothetical protein
MLGLQELLEEALCFPVTSTVRTRHVMGRYYFLVMSDETCDKSKVEVIVFSLGASLGWDT